MNKIRVLHCPANVGANPYGLARAERELGLQSWAVSFERHPLNYQIDETLFLDQDGLFVRELKRWRFLWRALRQFDIVHFNFGQSIMRQRVLESQMPPDRTRSMLWWLYKHYSKILELRDLPLIKRAGKGIAVTYQGDDARQGDFCLANFEINPVNEVEPGYYSQESDGQKRDRIARFAEYADRIYAVNPDLMRVLPKRAEFLPYSHIDLREWKPQISEPIHPKEEKSDRIPIVLHAPTHRKGKGTRFILDALSKLQENGIPLRSVLVEKVPHQEARELYQQADLLVDQLLAGWYGGVAVEFMALAKPVVCYIRENDLQFIPYDMRKDIPIIRATPTSIYNVLEQFLTSRRNELSEIGRRSREYVVKWHNPLRIAAKLKSDYQSMMARCNH